MRKIKLLEVEVDIHPWIISYAGRGREGREKPVKQYIHLRSGQLPIAMDVFRSVCENLSLKYPDIHYYAETKIVDGKEYVKYGRRKKGERNIAVWFREKSVFVPKSYKKLGRLLGFVLGQRYGSLGLHYERRDTPNR